MLHQNIKYKFIRQAVSRAAGSERSYSESPSELNDSISEKLPFFNHINYVWEQLDFSAIALVVP